MHDFSLVVVEFDLSSRDAAHIRKVVGALGLDLRAADVLESVRAALREGGMAAFELNHRCELWNVKVQYDPSINAVDTEHALAALRAAFGVAHVEWMPLDGSGEAVAGFGFNSPPAWCGPLVLGLGRTIRRRILEVVGSSCG